MTFARRWPTYVLGSLLVLCALVSVRADAPDEPDWTFDPLQRPAIPNVHDGRWERNAIDAFILAKLEAKQLRPNSPADKLTLLKRVTYDLTGLLPSSEEVAAFLRDESPDAYTKVVDRLLASPRFGERWAQHWLDVVRFAESEGFKFDRYRPEAWRYRDYVIDAFNNDLPYDRFVSQQIAGDELEPDNIQALIATGFYRLHPEESNGSDYRQIRQDILNDVTDVFGMTFMGLTMGCARCHDHKFDPITQNDYFELQAFFAPMVQRDDVQLAPGEMRSRYATDMQTWETATKVIRDEITTMLEPIRKDLFEELIVALDIETQAALRTPVEKRTPMQVQLAQLGSKQLNDRFKKMFRRLAPAQRTRYDELQKKLASFEKPKPLPTAFGVSDIGPKSPPVFRLLAGNYLKPREEVQPDFPECLELPEPSIHPPKKLPASTGRRSALAQWLVQGNHPLTSRVIVNRLWQHYFGRGIVATPNDFGEMGGNPSHPELLDFLGSELVKNGWRLKSIHRMIVLSATYQQSSFPEQNPTLAVAMKVDPENHLLWHTRVRRRDAEMIRDAILQSSGQLNVRMQGESARVELAPSVAENRYAWLANPDPFERNRRSIYVYQRRNLLLPMFQAFDGPDRTNSCPTRFQTVTAPQALIMLNGEFTLTNARQLASELLSRTIDPKELARLVYQRVLIRSMATEDAQRAVDFLTSQTIRIRSEGVPTESVLPLPLITGIDPCFAASVVDLCHALMNSAEFLSIE